MALACLTCAKVHSHRKDIKIGMPCMTEGCTGELSCVDRILLPTILVLNLKGYKTLSCRAGGAYSRKSKTVIRFAEGIIFKNYPANFEVTYCKNKAGGVEISIKRSHFDSPNMIKNQKQIFETAQNLLEWAEDLEVNQSMFD